MGELDLNAIEELGPCRKVKECRDTLHYAAIMMHAKQYVID
jgi:hypothetical protein